MNGKISSFCQTTFEGQVYLHMCDNFIHNYEVIQTNTAYLQIAQPLRLEWHIHKQKYIHVVSCISYLIFQYKDYFI